MDMVKKQRELKKRENPSFKNAKEALKDALKRMTTIEVVEYEPYEPPRPEPTVEQSLESLERTTEEVVEEEEGIEEGRKALENLTAETVKDDWTAMFDEERKKHPTIPEEVVKKVVDDHMYIVRRLAYLDSKTGGEERENPSKQDRVIKAFWEEKEASGPKATPMYETDMMADRRDRVVVKRKKMLRRRPNER